MRNPTSPRRTLRIATMAIAVMTLAPVPGGAEAHDAQGDRSAPKPGETRSFDATAYSVEGQTADGTKARPGVVAADPKVLPLGSKVEVQNAGKHSGTYVVEDTGPAIKGYELDVYVPSDHEAKQFGRKDVEVKVLERGTGRDGKPDAVPGPTGQR